MIYIDFSECEFIRTEMWYYTYLDFCDNRRALKRLFRNLGKISKRVYMYYVYANIHMDTKYKNAIWDYLNFDDPQYEINLLVLKHDYKAKL